MNHDTFRAGGRNRKRTNGNRKAVPQRPASFAELENILGRDKASLVHTFAADSAAGKIGELLLSGLRGYMV